MSAPDFTEDTILGGRLPIRQPARGYRVNLDTILLAAAVEAPSGARLMEAGCGVGAGLLAIAKRSENTHLVGLERDANIAAIARENVANNAMSSRIEIRIGDALDRNADWGVFDGVFVNPPYDCEGEGRAPSAARRYAYIAEEPIGRWISALANRLSGGAALTLIHRAARVPEIMKEMEGKLGGIELIPIRPMRDRPAKRVIVRARKGSRAPLRLLSGLDLHDDSGAKFTPEADVILKGEALLTWGD